MRQLSNPKFQAFQSKEMEKQLMTQYRKDQLTNMKKGLPMPSLSPYNNSYQENPFGTIDPFELPVQKAGPIAPMESRSGERLVIVPTYGGISYQTLVKDINSSGGYVSIDKAYNTAECGAYNQRGACG